MISAAVAALIRKHFKDEETKLFVQKANIAERKLIKKKIYHVYNNQKIPIHSLHNKFSIRNDYISLDASYSSVIASH